MLRILFSHFCYFSTKQLYSCALSNEILQQGVRFDPDMPQTIRLEFAKSNTKGKTRKAFHCCRHQRWEKKASLFFPQWDCSFCSFGKKVEGGVKMKKFYRLAWKMNKHFWTFTIKKLNSNHDIVGWLFTEGIVSMVLTKTKSNFLHYSFTLSYICSQ